MKNKLFFYSNDRNVSSLLLKEWKRSGSDKQAELLTIRLKSLPNSTGTAKPLGSFIKTKIPYLPYICLKKYIPESITNFTYHFQNTIV